MTNDIDVGFDCCNDYGDPTRTPRIYPRKPTMNTGSNINLYLKLVHPSCYESCFTWRILEGGGYLDPEFGIETYYHAPGGNEFCGQNPTIEAKCPRERMDIIRIGINGYRDEKLACFDIGGWREGKIVVNGRTLGMPAPTKHWWNLGPQYGACEIVHRDCAGRHLLRTAVGVIQMPRAYDNPEGGLHGSRFQQIYYQDGTLHLTREYGPGYASAKYWALRQHLAPFVDWGMPTGETLGHWLPFWKNWASGAQPRPGSVADVRNSAMLEAGCCNHFLTRKPGELPGQAL